MKHLQGDGAWPGRLANMVQAVSRRNRRLFLPIAALFFTTAFVWYGQVRHATTLWKDERQRGVN